jgi:AraC-like DNA-binding protein
MAGRLRYNGAQPARVWARAVFMPAPSTRRSATSSVRIVRATLQWLEALGLDTARLLARSGLVLEGRELDARVPLDQLYALWNAAAQTSRDPLLGLRAAAQLRPEGFDVVGYVCRTSRTLGDVIDRLSHYARLLDDSYVWELTVGDERVELGHRPGPAPPTPPALELCMSGGLSLMARRLTGAPLLALEVHFTQPSPARPEDLRAFFGEAVLHFDAPHSAIVFAREYLALPIVTHDPHLCAILERQAQQMLEQLPRGDGLSWQVREAILQGLHEGRADSVQVATRLAMSQRTLRRRLQEQGATFQNLLDEARFEMARRNLTQTELDVSQIAFRLGYSDVGSFDRAFRRWSGMSPLAFRKERPT